MVLFDDRRDNMPLIDKQQWQVLVSASDITVLMNSIQGCKDENKLYELRIQLLSKMRYLKEDCDKLKEIYRREGIKEIRI